MNAAFAGSGWNIALWIGQAFLCVMFLIAGILKLTKSPQGLEAIGWSWAASIPHRFIVFLGIMETAGAVGVVLPALLGVLPVFVPLAAFGMILVQISAIVLHAIRKETSKTLWLNAVLLAAALFVVWGRS